MLDFMIVMVVDWLLAMTGLRFCFVLFVFFFFFFWVMGCGCHSDGCS